MALLWGEGRRFPSQGYSDFAYLAFTVGMAFAVPEIRPTNQRTRRVLLGHALLSYVFSTGVLAVAISLLSGLGQ